MLSKSEILTPRNVFSLKIYTELAEVLKLQLTLRNYHQTCKFIMAEVYILYSEILDTYYIGSCEDFDIRFEEHISKTYSGSFTSRSDDWKLFLRIKDLGYRQSRMIETHIKLMKSRKYIRDLSEYPEIVLRLISKYC